MNIYSGFDIENPVCFGCSKTCDMLDNNHTYFICRDCDIMIMKDARNIMIICNELSIVSENEEAKVYLLYSDDKDEPLQIPSFDMYGLNSKTLYQKLKMCVSFN